MEFDKKYITETEAAVDNPDKKIILSNDAYAISEAVYNLIKKLDGFKK